MVLPRSLVPLPGESLIGFLLRLSHRLDIAPGELAQITGLEPQAQLTSRRLLRLDTAGAFATATGLSSDEAAQLTLAPLARRYPPVALHSRGRTRTLAGMFVREHWLFSGFTRYCPRCLAGDGSPIQEAHGGSWERTWRLPVVFGCTRHHSLLIATCPACSQPVHAKTAAWGLLPTPAVAGAHPAACRAPVGGPREICGHRLDTVDTVAMDTEQHRLHQRFQRLLHPGRSSRGAQGSPAQQFNALRVLSGMICSSWPVASASCGTTQQRALIDTHVASVRAAIAARRSDGRVVHELDLYDRPPADPASAAALLALADRLAHPDRPEQRDEPLRDMLAAMPDRQWLRQYRAGNTCSPQLAQALTAAAHPPPLSPPPRAVAFSADHIPALAPDDWLPADLPRRTGIRPIIIRRTVALRLAQFAIGGSIERAADAIGTPPSTAGAAAFELTQATADARDILAAAIEDVAALLNARAPHLTDYTRRRRAFAHFTISPQQWAELTTDLQDADTHRAYIDRPTDWADLKRLSASAWIWARVTGGEQRLAPAFRAAPHRTAPTSLVGATKSARYHLEHRDYGHYAALRARLTGYADTLAAAIDENGAVATPATAGRSAMMER
jgi:hypothetical protein